MTAARRGPSMADIARAAAVSVSTVSRALSGRGDLPNETRLRIQKAAAELGYKRGTSTRGRPVTADPRIVELVIGTFDDNWADEAIAGARQGAAQLGYDLVLTAERDDPADDWPSRVAARHSSGVILGLIRPTRSQLAKLTPLNIPIVLLDPSSDPHGELASIGTTDWQGGHDAGAHLADLGLKRFVVVVGLPPYRFGRAREEGFRRAVDEHAPGAQVTTIGGNWDDADLSAVLAPALHHGEEPVGVFACNDAMAIGVYKAAARLGLSIPGDLRVVGFDDEARSSALTPPLTTVRQPIRAMAFHAVRLIQDLRAGSASHRERVELPTRLVIRGSTVGD